MADQMSYNEASHPQYDMEADHDADTIKARLSDSEESFTESDNAESDTESSVPPMPTMVEAEDEKVCRVCRESTDADAMISPCRCRGTMGWIHRECWRQTSERCVPCGINVPNAPPADVLAHLLRDLNEADIRPVTFTRAAPAPAPAPNGTEALLAVFTSAMTIITEELRRMQQVSPRVRMMGLIVDAFASPFGRCFWMIMAAHIVLVCFFQLVILGRTAFAAAA